ncbi:2-oxoglutarate dehydrogenase complex E2 component [Penicillium ochrochloron]
MTRIRQKTARHLKESQNTAAFPISFNEVDMSNIMDFRKNNKDSVSGSYGVNLGFMGAMAKASVLALKEIPAVNTSVENDDTIVYRNYVDLHVAASIPKGLVTPILWNNESMSIVEIERGILSLSQR